MVWGVVVIVRFWFERVGKLQERIKNQFRCTDSAERVSCKLKRKQTRQLKIHQVEMKQRQPVLLT